MSHWFAWLPWKASIHSFSPKKQNKQCKVFWFFESLHLQKIGACLVGRTQQNPSLRQVGWWTILLEQNKNVKSFDFWISPSKKIGACLVQEPSKTHPWGKLVGELSCWSWNMYEPLVCFLPWKAPIHSFSPKKQNKNVKFFDFWISPSTKKGSLGHVWWEEHNNTHPWGKLVVCWSIYDGMLAVADCLEGSNQSTLLLS